MLNPFLYPERHQPVAVERVDLMPKRLLASRQRATPATPATGSIADAASGSAGGSRRGVSLLRRILR